MRIKVLILSMSCLLGCVFQSKALNGKEYMRYVAKADSLAAEEKWEEAENALKKALRSEPANPANQMLLTNLGMILTAQGKYGDALTHLNASLTLNPNSFIALKNRGMVYSAMNQIDNALSDFSIAIQLDSLDNDVRCLRATLYSISNNYDKAYEDYNIVLTRDRDNLSALEGLTQCAFARGKQEEAIPFLNRLIELKPDPDFHFSRGLALAQLGRFTEASEDVSQGLLLDPANGNLWLLRAYIEKITYRHNDAKTSLQKARRYGADSELEYQLLPDM